MLFSRPDTAGLCGVSLKRFDTRIRPLLPREAVHKEGGRVRFDGPMALKWYFQTFLPTRRRARRALMPEDRLFPWELDEMLRQTEQTAAEDALFMSDWESWGGGG